MDYVCKITNDSRNHKRMNKVSSENNFVQRKRVTNSVTLKSSSFLTATCNNLTVMVTSMNSKNSITNRFQNSTRFLVLDCTCNPYTYKIHNIIMVFKAGYQKKTKDCMPLSFCYMSFNRGFSFTTCHSVLFTI